MRLPAASCSGGLGPAEKKDKCRTVVTISKFSGQHRLKFFQNSMQQYLPGNVKLFQPIRARTCIETFYNCDKIWQRIL